MTTPHRRRDEINDEQAVNEEYLRHAERRRSNSLNSSRGVSAPRNALWAGSSRRNSRQAQVMIEPLIGRVALDYNDADLSASFYVGSWHTPLDHTVVISWAAKSARLLFAGRASRWHDPDPRRLRARRTFQHRGELIADFYDDVEPGEADPDTVFARQSRTLHVPPGARERWPWRRIGDHDRAHSRRPSPFGRPSCRLTEARRACDEASIRPEQTRS